MYPHIMELWLKGEYSRAVEEIMEDRDTPGEVESIRLVIGGRPANRTINLEMADYETYAQDFTDTYGKDSVEAIDGFLLRIRKKIL